METLKGIFQCPQKLTNVIQTSQNSPWLSLRSLNKWYGVFAPQYYKFSHFSHLHLQAFVDYGCHLLIADWQHATGLVSATGWTGCATRKVFSTACRIGTPLHLPGMQSTLKHCDAPHWGVDLNRDHGFAPLGWPLVTHSCEVRSLWSLFATLLEHIPAPICFSFVNSGPFLDTLFRLTCFT